MSRQEMLDLLPQMDVGVSLIPKSKIYEEASPTKMSEYMVSVLQFLRRRVFICKIR